MSDLRYDTLMGRGPKKIIHWEHWSNPDAEKYLTGIDYYDHPRLCRLKMTELYPQLNLHVPETDAPKKRPNLGSNNGQSANDENHTVRWGDSETGTWEHGEAFFKKAEDVFAFSPLEKADFSDWPHVVMNWDYSSEDAIYQRLLKQNLAEWDANIAKSGYAETWFYNTMFMWPMLTFGWELFLECCLDKRFERIMDEFAEINRRVFKAFARLPVNFVTCHDDIVMTRGPVCSPKWMKKYIYPRYEEYWGILKNSGKKVIFMSDGCVDDVVDDVMACGAMGIISEPYTNYKEIAKKYKDCFLAGEGDNRILSRNNPVEIKEMVYSMVETGKMCNGYMMCIGNHIPWDIHPEAIKLYLDLSSEVAYR